MTARRTLIAIAVATTIAQLAHAQSSTATLIVTLAGEIARTESRIHVVLTTADPEARVVRSDSGVRKLELDSLPAGRFRLETRAIGFAPETSYVELHAGRDANVTVILDRVTALDPVSVSGTNKGHLAAFETRRAGGKGTFLTQDDLARTRRTVDALRLVRGLRVDCDGGNCRVLMVRSTTCEPRYFINGFPTTSEILLTPVLDVAGIEVYRGPSETPPEFLGARSMCGAVGVWTK